MTPKELSKLQIAITELECQKHSYADDVGEETCTIAITALEKQVPKKPIKGKCEHCNNTQPFEFPFCPYCGQKLDWSEEK